MLGTQRDVERTRVGHWSWPPRYLVGPILHRCSASSYCHSPSLRIPGKDLVPCIGWSWLQDIDGPTRESTNDFYHIGEKLYALRLFSLPRSCLPWSCKSKALKSNWTCLSLLPMAYLWNLYPGRLRAEVSGMMMFMCCYRLCYVAPSGSRDWPLWYLVGPILQWCYFQ